jgi:hypothetical protein
MDKFIKPRSSRWVYQPQGGRDYGFSTRRRPKRRLSFQHRPIKRRIDTYVALATVEALIAIINVLEEE